MNTQQYLLEYDSTLIRFIKKSTNSFNIKTIHKQSINYRKNKKKRILKIYTICNIVCSKTFYKNAFFVKIKVVGKRGLNQWIMEGHSFGTHRMKTMTKSYLGFTIVTALLFCQTHNTTVVLWFFLKTSVLFCFIGK